MRGHDAETMAIGIIVSSVFTFVIFGIRAMVRIRDLRTREERMIMRYKVTITKGNGVIKQRTFNSIGESSAYIKDVVMKDPKAKTKTEILKEEPK